MKTMKIKLIAMLLVVVLAFTGCMKLDATVVINQDGSAKIGVTTLVDKQAILDSVAQMNGVAMTAEEVAAYDQSMVEQGYTIVTVDGKEYYQLVETQNVKAGELSSYFGGEGAEAYVTVDTVYLKYESADAASDSADMAEMQAYAEQMGAEMSLEDIEYNISFEFPSPIVSTNGTVDSANPNKVTFSISMVSSSTLFATTKSGVTEASVKAEIAKLNKINAPKIKKLKADKVKRTAKKATATLKIKRVKGAKNYQIQYSLKKNFKNAKNVTTKKLTYKLKKLKKGKKYYVRVRACKINYAGQKVYSKWTKKTVKTKK